MSLTDLGLQSLFAAAVELGSAAERARFLDRESFQRSASQVAWHPKLGNPNYLTSGEPG